LYQKIDHSYAGYFILLGITLVADS